MKSVNEEKFDSFLNKTIIMSSRKYFLKQMRNMEVENTILDSEDFANFVQGFASVNGKISDMEEMETSMQLNAALNCLSRLEQAVIFLLFNEELSRNETAEILKLYDSTVSKIKRRAIDKLKKLLEGGFEDEQ